MAQSSAYQLFQLGAIQRYLENIITPQHPIHGDNYVFENLRHYLQMIESLNLSITMITGVHSELKSSLSNFESLSPETLLGNRCKELMANITLIKTTLAAELRTLPISIKSNKELIYPGLFSSKIWKKFSKFSQKDFLEAESCLRNGEYTAASFLMLRATEGFLRTFYKKRSKKEPSERWTWANVSNNLKAYLSKREEKELVPYLNQIREHYRNPTAHPQRQFEEEDAKHLMGVCGHLCYTIYKMI